MLVTEPLREYDSSYDSTENASFRTSPAASSSRSPSKSSATMSNYSSSCSSSSSPINGIDAQQYYNVDSGDGTQLPPFPASANNVFPLSKGKSPSSSAHSGFGQYMSMAENNADCKVKTEAMMNNQQAYDITPPHTSQDVDFFGKGFTDAQYDPVRQQCQQTQQPTTPRKSYEHVTDKELRKKLKNRESAQAARDRKKAKMLSLERQIAELLERNRLVEMENHKLRARIHQMEAESYWRITKQDSGRGNVDANTAQGYTGTLQQQNYPGASTQYEKHRDFQQNCSYTNTYIGTHPNAMQVGNEPVNQVDRNSFHIINNLPTETQLADDFSPTFSHNIWDTDVVSGIANENQTYVANCAFTPTPTSLHHTSSTEGVLG